MTGHKFRHVVLHFGIDKTGSTAIQSAMDASRQMLLESGLIAYPPGHWHAQLGSAFCDLPDEYTFNTQRGLRDRDLLRRTDVQYLRELKQWLATVPDCETLVFSYEGYPDLDVNALHRFKAFCENYADSVRVLMYVRSPLSYAVSAMSQRVKQGRKSWVPSELPVWHYKPTVEKIVQAFGKSNVCLRLFSSTTLKNGDVIADFMSVLGVPEEVAAKVSACRTPPNRSLTEAGMRFGEMLIRLFDERCVVRTGDQFHIKYGQYLSSIPGGRVRLTGAQIDEILVSSSIHTEYLRQEFGIDLADDVKKYLRSNSDTMPGQDELLHSMAAVLTDMLFHEHHHHKSISVPDLVIKRATVREGENISRGNIMTFDVEFVLAREAKNLEMGIHIFDSDRRWAFGTNSTLLGQSHQSVPAGSYRVIYHLAAELPSGKYTAGFAFAEKLPEGQHDLAWHDALCEFQVYFEAGGPFAGYAYLPAQISLCPTST